MKSLQLLAKIDPFAFLPPDQLEKIAPLFREQIIKPETLFIEQGKLVSEFGIIQCGSATVKIYDYSGQEHHCGNLYKGDTLFDLNLLSNSPATACIIFLEETVCHVLSAENFISTIETYPQLKDFFYYKATNGIKACHELFCGHHLKSQTTFTSSDKSLPFWKKTEWFIEDNYYKPISLERIAKEAAMSKYHFCRKFKEHFGLSFKQYLNKKRINVAKQLLKEQDYSITDVGFSVGFNDASYFSKVFREIEDCSPKQFVEAQTVEVRSEHLT